VGNQELGRGVLHQDVAASRLSLARYPPSAELEPFVDFHWIVRWDLCGQPLHEQKILPHPNVNIAFEESGSAVYGVDRKLFVRRLVGHGKALGVRLRPGGFRPFWNAPVSRLTDRTVPATEVFGAAAATTQEAIMSAPDDAAMVSRINADPALMRVDQLAAATGLSVRRLQRLFAEFVGVGPKWVMSRARLHEAAQRADRGDGAAWAAVAADLGYADQAHLTREFTAMIGIPPARYAHA
jgi:AraC-like DNA-binding protein